jgi:hypothetical protein
MFPDNQRVSIYLGPSFWLIQPTSGNGASGRFIPHASQASPQSPLFRVASLTVQSTVTHTEIALDKVRFAFYNVNQSLQYFETQKNYIMKNFMNEYKKFIDKYFGAMDRGTVFILGQIVAAAGITAGFFAHQYYAGNPLVTVDSISHRDTGAVLEETCARAINQWLETGSSNAMADLSSRQSPKTSTTAPQPKP